MNKLLLRLTVFLLLLLSVSPAIAQQKNKTGASPKIDKLTNAVSSAIKKCYQASVLMWEIDGESGQRMSAQFSGVVVSASGQIFSAAHVVHPGKSYQVMFPDGRKCVARGLGRIAIAPTHMIPDAAALKIIDKGTWPFVQPGWSSSVWVNEPCISIAYPESQEQRKPYIRFGRISVLKNEYGFIESACLMEPGDSGGPLFDLSGRLIGLHSGIQQQEDINYEIPVDTYRKYLTALNREEDYASMPKDSDAVGMDNAPLTAKNIPSATNLNQEFKAADKAAKVSCAKISSNIGGQAQHVLGTIINPDIEHVKASIAGKGVIVSKSSMVGVDPVITLPDGVVIKGAILARDKVNDLVLLIPASDKKMKGISLKALNTDSVAYNDLGKFLISPLPDSTASISVVGSLFFNLPKVSSYGYLGAVTGEKDDKLIFTYIQPKSAAEQAGITVSDQLLAVDGKVVKDQLDVLKSLQKYRAGDTTTFTILSKDVKLDKTVVLKYPPQKVTNHPVERFAGGKSLRRDGFNNIFAHDARIKPYECGGPVFNVAGYLMGINIARLSRTTTIVMPSGAVKSFVTANLVDK
ncbi:S1 family peptidase [Mucilaginibacter celer]|uniref:PDZ domain-containing protein n=1 Tax=Mucilaginibacter celer TaxID=2305508 RepID=A0A494VKF0_9SPHI|nr:trypsin-like peptidase domain-containing protein [Mucilaginibacter celer]AYL95627.1 PDZ domain-containing protein [Mucilaginibacter celer]